MGKPGEPRDEWRISTEKRWWTWERTGENEEEWGARGNNGERGGDNGRKGETGGEKEETGAK